MKNYSFGMKVLSNNFNASLVNIPTPVSISYMWNFGSVLGLCLSIQILTGFFLSTHYEASIEMAFDSIVLITNDINMGWVIRNIHANGASMFFICLYVHIGRGIYFNSVKFSMVWFVGILIVFVLMAVAFLGYVLPWGQMSFWGATVITNLISAVPYVGNSVVTWLWGGFSINKPTLIRFFSIHYIMPFIVLILVLMHIAFLHASGSSNPLGLSMNSYKVNFHPYFIYKDLVGFFFIISFLMFCLLMGDFFMDPDNFSIANPMETPAHIKPEWYFLFAYAILRSIPNKLGGVVGLVMSIMVLMLLPLMKGKVQFSVLKKFVFWMLVINFVLLSILGSKLVEYPFSSYSQILTITYFSFFFALILMNYNILWLIIN